MEYPDGFPDHMQARVDAAIHEAELLIIDKFRDHPDLWQGAVFMSAKTVFYAFAEQVCELGSSHIWSGQRMRVEIENYLASVAMHYHDRFVPTDTQIRDKCENQPRIVQSIKDLPEWRDLQERMKQIAESHGEAISPKPAVALNTRRAYRPEVHAWMKAKGIQTISAAAERIKVSQSVLKSIMSSRGKRKYSDETLAEVLRRIGHR